MSKNLHIVPKEPLREKQKYESAIGCLTLDVNQRSFNVVIKKDASAFKDEPKPLPPFRRLSQKEVDALPNRQAKEIYVANHKKRDKDEADYKAKKEAFEKAHAEELSTLSWCWQAVMNGVEGKQIKHNNSFVKGFPKDGVMPMNFPEIFVGGGLAWLEVFTKNDPATGKLPQGMFVRAFGTPEIVRVSWTDLECRPIQGKVNFGSKVLLNIYTKGLYGQDVEIGLWDKDVLDPDDSLSISNKKNFMSEVLTYEVLPNEVNKGGISGNLNVNNESVTHVQKIRVAVLIDPIWISSAGTELKIYPTVKSIEKGTFFKLPEDRFIEVDKKSGLLQKTVIEATNNPLLVGQVETNVASFRPCRYDKIVLKKQSKEGETELFNALNTEHRIKKITEIEIVAGKKETYLLDFDLKTQECERKPKHTTKEITILTIPKDYELKVDASSKAEHRIKKEEKGLVKTESKNSFSVSHMGGLKTTQKEEFKEEKGIVTVRQKQIEFDSFYNYDIPMNSITTFPKALKYFWLPDLGEDKIGKISAQVISCAFQQNINITIYPDIKWSLVLAFNVKEDQLKVLFPSWDKEKIVKPFELKAEKLSQKFKNNVDEKTKEDINNQVLGAYKDVYGRPQNETPKKEKETHEKGKLSTLLEIMKNVDFSLKAQIYGENELELSRPFFENALNKELYIDFYKKMRWFVDMFDGKLDNPKNKNEGDKAINEYLKNNEFNRRATRLKDALTRPPQEIEILYPKISLGGDWQYSNIDAQKYPSLIGRAGLAYNVALIAKPLMGIEIKWHILDLLCRRHPIAYAVLAAVKTLLAALGDNPDGIKVDFWVKGLIDTDIKFNGNSLSKEKQIAFRGESHITAGVEINIMLVGKVVQGKYTAVAELGVGGKGEVGLGLEGSMGVDNYKGIWLQTSLIFDGIKLSFEAVISARIVKNRVKDDGTVEEVKLIGGEEKIEGEITMFSHTFKSEKFYLK